MLESRIPPWLQLQFLLLSGPFFESLPTLTYTIDHRVYDEINLFTPMWLVSMMFVTEAKNEARANHLACRPL